MKYAKVSKKPAEFLAMTGYTMPEFAALLPHFAKAFADHMRDYTLEGYRRENRAYVTYRNSPLPTTEDKLFFILVYLKQAPTQTYQANMFDMRQSKANLWIHVLHGVLKQTLANLDELPSRQADELITAEEYPLFGMMPLNDQSTALLIRKNNANTTAASRKTTH